VKAQRFVNTCSRRQNPQGEERDKQQPSAGTLCLHPGNALSAATPEVVTGSRFPAAKKALSDTAGCHPHSAASCSCRKTVPFPMFA